MGTFGSHHPISRVWAGFAQNPCRSAIFGCNGCAFFFHSFTHTLSTQEHPLLGCCNKRKASSDKIYRPFIASTLKTPNLSAINFYDSKHTHTHVHLKFWNVCVRRARIFLAEKQSQCQRSSRASLREGYFKVWGGEGMGREANWVSCFPQHEEEGKERY